MIAQFDNSFLRWKSVGGISLIIAGVLLLSLSAASCTSSTPQKPQSNSSTTTSATEQPTPVKVGEVKETKASLAVTYSGDVKPKTQVSLSTKAIGRIEELSVEVGSKVRAGDVIGHLDQASIKAGLNQAQAALAAAKAKQSQLRDGARAESVAQAEANLRAAQARLAQLNAGATPEQLESAQAAVRAASNQLDSTDAQSDAYLGSKAYMFGAIPYSKNLKEALAGVAYEQMKLAEARLAELKAGATKEQLDQAQAAVDAAQAQLDLAKNPYTRNDLDAADAAVAQAQATVDLAKSQLADTDIISPVDGVVSDKFLSVGALVSPQVPILNIISSELEVAIAVEEARAGQIRKGQQASLTVGAYPDQTFAGTVSNISPAIDPKSRTFTVKVSPIDDQGVLKAGMFAKVSINPD